MRKNKEINNNNKTWSYYAKQQKWTKVFFSTNHFQTVLISLKPERTHFAKELALFRCFHISQPCSLHGWHCVAILHCTQSIMKKCGDVDNPKHLITSKHLFKPAVGIHLFFQRICCLANICLNTLT